MAAAPGGIRPIFIDNSPPVDDGSSDGSDGADYAALVKPPPRDAHVRVDSPPEHGDTQSVITSNDCELSWVQYNKRSMIMSLMVALSAVPVFSVTLITDIRLQHTYHVGGVDLAMYKLMAFVLVGCGVLSLFVSPMLFPCMSDTVIGVVMVALAIAGNVVVAFSRTSLVTALVGCGLGGVSLGLLWLTPGVCVDSLLKAHPDGSLGLAAGMVHFFLHLILLPLLIIETLSEPAEWISTEAVAGVCGIAALLLHATRPMWDGGTCYHMGKASHPTPLTVLWSDLGSVNLLFFTLFFHGVSWFEAWVDLPYSVAHTDNATADDVMIRKLSYVMPVAIGGNAVSSLVVGFVANFVAPSWGIAGSTVLLLTGRVLKYIYHPNETAEVFILTALLFALGLAGYNIQIFCFLERLIQQYNASPVTVFLLWGVISGGSFALAVVGTEYIGHTTSFVVYASLGVVAFLCVLAASSIMSSGRGWHGLLPRASSLRFDGTSTVGGSSVALHMANPNSSRSIAAKALLRTSVSAWSLGASPQGYPSNGATFAQPTEETSLWAQFASLPNPNQPR